MATGSMVRGLSCCAVGMNVPGGGAGGAAPPRPLRPTSQMIAATTTTLAAAMPSTESCRWVDQAYRREVAALESLLLIIYGAPRRCHLFKLQRTPRRRSGNRAMLVSRTLPLSGDVASRAQLCVERRGAHGQAHEERRSHP